MESRLINGDYKIEESNEQIDRNESIDWVDKRIKVSIVNKFIDEKKSVLVVEHIYLIL